MHRTTGGESTFVIGVDSSHLVTPVANFKTLLGVLFGVSRLISFSTQELGVAMILFVVSDISPSGLRGPSPLSIVSSVILQTLLSSSASCTRHRLEESVFVPSEKDFPIESKGTFLG